MYWEYYMLGIILLPGIIFAAWAEYKVHSAYSKYSTVLSSKGITGAEVSSKILSANGISNVQIKQINGQLSDNYNPTKKTLSLSRDVYSGATIAALGVAAHECGHAIQDAKKYAPIKVRNFFAVVCNISNTLLWPIVFIGLILGIGAGSKIGLIFVYSGIAFFGFSVLFSLITLPVELNASKRALKSLVDVGALDQMEVIGAKEVLKAAALTYVAGLLVSILNLLRFILVIRNND